MQIRDPAKKPLVAISIPSGDLYFHFEFSLVSLPYSSVVPMEMKATMNIHLTPVVIVVLDLRYD